MERNNETRSGYSAQGHTLTPSMQKIGTGLVEVSDILKCLKQENNINNDIRKKLDEALLKVEMLRKFVKESRSESATDANHRRTLTEKQRVEIADEMHRRNFLAKIDNAIIEGMSGGNIDIQCLTDRLCMSRSTLYRRMKTLTGISANEYVRKKRMEIAKELLIDGDIPVSEIAFKVGCSSMSYFRQSFKEIYGVIPSEYLRRLKSS